MQIKKNIAAILQNRLKCFGKKKLKFSEELGLPRFILQSFLKGNAELRSDSFEELTKCLVCGISLRGVPVQAPELPKCKFHRH